MSLESLKTVKKYIWDIPDQQVQRLYTKLGQKIPKKHLYLGSLGANYIGTASIVLFISNYFGPEAIATMGFPASAVLTGADHALTWKGLAGKLDGEVDGEYKALDFEQEFAQGINRVVRWPVFVTATGLLGKSAYDVIKYLTNGEPLNSETAWNLTTGLGLLGLASSMYIKDQDTTLLKKEPSKIKAFFEKLRGFYETAKEKSKELLPSPNPIPQPVLVPVQRYGNLESYVQAQPFSR